MISFIFNIGSAFIDYPNHPLTIPKRYYEVLAKEGLANKHQDVAITCPNGRKVTGYIIYGVANWGPFYQIKFYSQVDSPVQNLEIGQRILVEIIGSTSGGIINLKLYDSTQNISPTPINNIVPEINDAIDLEVPPEELGRETIQVKRIIRDTKIAIEVKELNKYRCQLCNYRIEFDNGQIYAEAHHAKPLGSPHNGPDSIDNILCVCPNCHAKLDYGAMLLEMKKVNTEINSPSIRQEYIDYHNEQIYRKI